MEAGIRRLKVAWVMEVFPNPYQGYILNLLENLESSGAFDITVFAYKVEIHNQSHKIVRIRSYGYFGQILRRILGLTFLERRLMNFDIVHLQHSYMLPWIRNMVTIRRRCRYVITLRGADSYVKPWISVDWREYHHFLSRNFDAIQVMSSNQMEYIKRWGHHGRNCFIIPISTSTKQPVFKNISLEKDGEIKICSVFRMVWEKNIEMNLRFIKGLLEKGIKIRYDIFGDGSDLGQVFYLVELLGLVNVVRIHGRVQPAILTDEISNSHFVLQLSSSEALPASVIEAFSFGIPCVVTSVGGFQEIVRSGINGFIIDFAKYDIEGGAEFVLNAIGDERVYVALREKAFDTYQKEFAPGVEARRVAEMYYQISRLG